MEYKLNTKKYYKFNLDTDDATVSQNSTEFTFQNILPVDIQNKAYLKVSGISANTSTDKIYNIKLKSGIDYNKSKYYGSDKSGFPILITRCFNGKSSLNLSNHGIEIPPQIINDIVFEITDTTGAGLTGASQKMIIELVIDEVEN